MKVATVTKIGSTAQKATTVRTIENTRPNSFQQLQGLRTPGPTTDDSSTCWMAAAQEAMTVIRAGNATDASK